MQTSQKLHRMTIYLTTAQNDCQFKCFIKIYQYLVHRTIDKGHRGITNRLFVLQANMASDYKRKTTPVMKNNDWEQQKRTLKLVNEVNWISINDERR